MARKNWLSERQDRRRLVKGAMAVSMVGTGVTAAGGTRGISVKAQEPGAHVQAVVSAHEVATGAGLAMLAQGGSAADASIAVAAALTVVEGWFSSVLGGGTWALYYDAANGEVTSLDGVGPTGSKATREDYEARAASPGIHQSNVPGAWDGWMLWLERYGRLDLGQVLEPAIGLARNGFPASAELVLWLSDLQNQIFSFPDSQRTYAPDGVLPAEGDTIYMPELADTFESLVIAYNGGLAESRSAAVQAARDHYYRGPLAEAIVAYSDEYDGYLTHEDFNGFAAEVVPPVSIQYGDITLFQNPPNSQGITMLIGLNILKEMGLSQYDVDDPDAVHTQIEAMKLAFADRYEHIGDPERVEIPLEELLSDEYAARQRERIDVNNAMEWPIESGVALGSVPSHTTTFQIIDRDGNAASVTTSLGAQFLVVGDTGIHMNNRMRMLSVEEGNANELTPGYKVRHTSCPYLGLRDGRLHVLGGNTGVDTQPQGQLQQFLGVVEFGLSAQGAISRPRWVSTAFPSTAHPWEAGNQLRVQPGFTPTLLSMLQVKGHEIAIGEGPFGAASMLIVNEDGTDADVGVEPGITTSAGEVIPAGG
jgi:gamma-glutamyltranspeptidase/glutathione hydrolase